jgi:hypothetical protein
LKILIAHGRFIRANLEFSYRAPSNHYLSDLIGLLSIGATLTDLKESRRWTNFSAKRLFIELMRQVYPDGVSYEGAIGYHRLVMEIFALFFALRRSSHATFPLTHRNRLEKMFDFARHYLKPDGSAPMIGDSDDGRLIRFKDRPAGDHSYLMSIGAALFEKRELKLADRPDEEALWWLGERGLERFNAIAGSERAAPSRAFSDSQIFITRQGPAYAVIDCGDHGLRGRGSHAHSDALSIEVFAYGQTFLRDPGTFVYTGNPELRNLFRSTAYHNTVRVDGQDVSRIDETQLFALGENVRPKINHWKSDAQRDLLDAEHHGYSDLSITHRRIITFDKNDLYWTVEDRFTGEGAHAFEFFFNFDAGLEVALQEDGTVIALGEEAGLMLAMISGHAFQTQIVDRRVSPAYGERVGSSGMICRLSASVPFENKTLLIPFRRGCESKAAGILIKSEG